MKYKKIEDLPLTKFQKEIAQKFGAKPHDRGVFICPKHGEFKGTRYLTPEGIITNPICEKCREEENRRQILEDSKLLLARDEANMIKNHNIIGLPACLKDKDFRDFDVAGKEVRKKILSLCKKMAKNLSNGVKCLLFYGDTGVGKSILAVSIGKEIAKQGLSVYYTEEDDFQKKLEKARNGEGSRVELIKKYETCGLLIVDEIGAAKWSVSATVDFSNMIKHRLDNYKMTLMVSNVSDWKVLKEHLGDPLISRMEQLGRRVRMEGTDFRKDKKLF